MKKNYSYILLIFALVVFFFTTQKTYEFSLDYNGSLRAQKELEEFYRSRIDQKRAEEINKIIEIAENRKKEDFLENKIKAEIEEVSREASSYVRDLEKTYPQVKGRIIIEGTEIDFPVVQGNDNEFYLDHDYDNTYYINGAVFIDHVHRGDFSDQNTVIYGHNVRIGYIFNDLNKFRDKNFVKDHSEIIIDTPKARRVFEVVCAMDVDADADYRFYEYDDHEFEDYLNLIKENNILEAKPLPKKEDKLITLSTCSDLNDRFAIVAVEKKSYTRPDNFDNQKNLIAQDRRNTRKISIY